MKASASRALPSSFLVTSNTTSSDLPPAPIPSVVVSGAKPGISKFPWSVVAVALLNAFLVALSTGAVKRVLYITYKPLLSNVPPFGLMLKWFGSVTVTSVFANSGRVSALFHSVK